MNTKEINQAAREHAKAVLGAEQFKKNKTSAESIATDFKAGVSWREEQMKLPEGKIMTVQELNDKMDQILKENNMDWQQIHLWISRKGYVIITEEQYENMEVIDQDGPCP